MMCPTNPAVTRTDIQKHGSSFGHVSQQNDNSTRIRTHPEEGGLGRGLKQRVEERGFLERGGGTDWIALGEREEV